jgi:adenylate cyclase
MARAPEYHGQMADPFEPLGRHGLLPGLRGSAASADDWLRTFEEVHAHNRDLEERIRLRTQELLEEHARSERLLRNILPGPIAERLKTSPATIADAFDDVSVAFTDLVGFTPLAASMSPTRLVGVLDDVFRQFDATAERHGLEKIKTIGDCYMVVGGLPEPRPDHAAQAARAALAFVEALRETASRTGVELACRTGLHAGAVVAGVIGTREFSYDLWGDTVNLASRMESHGAPGRIHCSTAMRERLGERFRFEPRGTIEIKGKGATETWWLLGER